MKEQLQKAKSEISTLERARDTFKTQFMELKEINKELKTQFKELQSQMQAAMFT